MISKATYDKVTIAALELSAAVLKTEDDASIRALTNFFNAETEVSSQTAANIVLIRHALDRAADLAYISTPSETVDELNRALEAVEHVR